MNIFYTPAPSDSPFPLSEEESRHCVKVLRKKAGDFITLADGIGNWYKATIIDAHPKNCLVQIEEKQEKQKEWNFDLEIAIAPPKNTDRFEWFLEKATEIGIDTISILITEHSERKHIKTERLERVLLSAMKQSLKAHLPFLKPAVSFKNYLQESRQKHGEKQKMIASCITPDAPHLKSRYQTGKNAVILIGPEGDFSSDEVSWAQEAGFQSINLGKSRLRLETAALVACSAIHILNS